MVPAAGVITNLIVLEGVGGILPIFLDLLKILIKSAEAEFITNDPDSFKSFYITWKVKL